MCEPTDPEGSVAIVAGEYVYQKFDGWAPADNDAILTMPTKVFHGLLKRWWANEFGLHERDKITYQGALLKEENPPFRWRLTYKDWNVSIFLYDSTLTYLCVHNSHRWKNES